MRQAGLPAVKKLRMVFENGVPGGRVPKTRELRAEPGIPGLTRKWTCGVEYRRTILIQGLLSPQGNTSIRLSPRTMARGMAA